MTVASRLRCRGDTTVEDSKMARDVDDEAAV